jgi:sulfatase modifying factor 1
VQRYRVGESARNHAPISTNTPFVVTTSSVDDAPPASAAPIRSRARILVPIAIAVTLLLAIFGLTRDTESIARIVDKMRFAHAGVGAGALQLQKTGVEGVTLEEIAICTNDMALVQRDDLRVCVDRYEASLVEVRADGEEKPWSAYQSPPSGRTFKAVSKPGVVPQGYISRNQAEAACFGAGKRLCTSSEWRSACEGPERTTWTYGAKEDSDACNTHGVNPLSRLFGGPSKIMWKQLEMNNPTLNAIPGTVAATGSFAKCTNDFGVYDMVGNLHEWTSEKKGVFRGGYYRDTHENGAGCGYATKAHASSYHDYSTGFRCCRDPE